MNTSDRQLEDIRAEAEELYGRYSVRDQMFEEIRRMFHMEWTDNTDSGPQPGTTGLRGDWIKATMSPSAYNAVIGAVRLMTSSEPQISVPFDERTQTSAASDKIERWCKAVWNGSGRVAQRPPHFDALFSAVLFGEICAAVTKTSELLKYAEQTKKPALINRMKHVAGSTPYLFTPYNPATCYTDFDTFGVRAMLRRVETTWGEVLASWGQLAYDSLAGQAETKKYSDPVTLNDWWDWEVRAVWLEEGAQEILIAPHGMEFLPIVAQITDGSGIFTKPEEARFPLLYAVWKSGLWKRENLSLTVIFSLMFALGSNPLLVRNTPTPGSPLTIDRTVPGGVIDINVDEKLTPLAEKVMDQSLMTGINLAQQLNQESTISKQSLGVPPGFQMPYSAISLLAQSGRLPLIGPMTMGGDAVANLMIAALRWYKQDNQPGAPLMYAGRLVELAPEDVPDQPVVNVVLEPDVPQDKLQLANTALALKQAGLASDRWIQEKILQIGQAGAMRKEIWMEQRLMVEMQKIVTRITAEAEAALRAKLAPPPPAAAGGPAPSAGANGQVQPGQPLAGPLPPQSAR